jgi:hypothetical protein
VRITLSAHHDDDLDWPAPIQPKGGDGYYDHAAEAVGYRSSALFRTRRRGGPLGLTFIQAISDYEWVVPALNKILDSGFGAGLADKLAKSVKDNPQSLAMRTSSL